MTAPIQRLDGNDMTTCFEEETLAGFLSGSADAAIKSFCHKLPELPKSCYPEALLGMGYLCESFDLMFAVIACSIQATHDDSNYEVRYKTMQNVLRPFASEFGIEPDRPLMNPHRDLFAKFYELATGETWPLHYPVHSDNPWLERGRFWTHRMLSNLQRNDLGPIDRAKYNLGYHWAVEFVSVGEFHELCAAWQTLGVKSAWLDAHSEVEPEHASCAAAAVAAFTTLDDPLVIRGIRDHENDLAGFYTDFAELIHKHGSQA